ELHARVNGPKPQDKDKAQWPMDRDAFLKQFEKNPFDLAWTVFQVAADESNPRLERVRFWADLLRSAKPLVKFAETDFVVRIEKLSADGAEWPVQAVHHALHLTRDAERVAAGSSNVLPWVQAWLDEVQRKRPQALELLFSEDAAMREPAPSKLRETAQDYSVLLQHMQTIDQGLRLRDEALAFLPSYPAYFEINAADEAAWMEAVRATGELRDELAEPPSATTKLPADAFK